MTQLNFKCLFSCFCAFEKNTQWITKVPVAKAPCKLEITLQMLAIIATAVPSV